MVAVCEDLVKSNKKVLKTINRNHLFTENKIHHLSLGSRDQLTFNTHLYETVNVSTTLRL